MAKAIPIKPRTVRLLWVIALVAAVCATVFGVLRVFNDNLVLFYTPTQLLNDKLPTGRSYRIGGMVEKSSLIREPGTTKVTFKITDMVNSVPVTYNGVTPDLFREGKGVVAQGKMEGKVFVATEILAKHDENYNPPKLNNNS
jgi:cytochrome c-type biogenesis protein CcmE